MKAIFTILASAAIAPAMAQFDYGLSAGGVLTNLWASDSDSPHDKADINNVTPVVLTATAFYREQSAPRVNFGVDLTYIHRAFDAALYAGGLGGGSTRVGHVEMDQLYFGLKPEVRMDAKGHAVVRFGAMAGFLVGGSTVGYVHTMEALPGMQYGTLDFQKDFKSDMRLAFGFGLKVPLGGHWAFSIDPEATFAITSMLKDRESRSHGIDLGLRVGLVRQSKAKGFTSGFKLPKKSRAGTD